MRKLILTVFCAVLAPSVHAQITTAPLSDALNKLVPIGWELYVRNEIPERRLVGWKASPDWRIALKQIAENHNLDIRFNAAKRQVFVDPLPGITGDPMPTSGVPAYPSQVRPAMPVNQNSMPPTGNSTGSSQFKPTDQAMPSVGMPPGYDAAAAARAMQLSASPPTGQPQVQAAVVPIRPSSPANTNPPVGSSIAGYRFTPSMVRESDASGAIVLQGGLPLPALAVPGLTSPGSTMGSPGLNPNIPPITVAVPVLTPPTSVILSVGPSVSAVGIPMPIVIPPPNFELKLDASFTLNPMPIKDVFDLVVRKHGFTPDWQVGDKEEPYWTRHIIKVAGNSLKADLTQIQQALGAGRESPFLIEIANDNKVVIITERK